MLPEAGPRVNSSCWPHLWSQQPLRLQPLQHQLPGICHLTGSLVLAGLRPAQHLLYRLPTHFLHSAQQQ